MDAKIFLSNPQPPDTADISAGETAALKAAASAAGFLIFNLDGTRMLSKAELLDYTAGVLGFPNETGMNWDAAIDYLSDMPSFHDDADKFLVIVNNSGDISRANPALEADLRETFALSAEKTRQAWRGKTILKFAFVR